MDAWAEKRADYVECPGDQPLSRPRRRRSSAISSTSGDGENCRQSSLRINKSLMNSGDVVSDQKSLAQQASIIDELVDILQKDAANRSETEVKQLEEWGFLIPEAQCRIKAKIHRDALRERNLEREEAMEVIEEKSEILAKLIRDSKNIVIYTGAGISTSASIPDYRGPNGLWTQIRRTGSYSITKTHDLTSAEPTYTHMAIKELCRRRLVKHVVSQNCDGLHLRSGIPQSKLSEIHGNMFIEVCPTCEKQYFRQTDVTGRTARFRHKTGRKCHSCIEPNNNLLDTIVLFGERSRTQWPMNWERASKAAKHADLIICLGSSLKTLRRYSCLWPKGLNSSRNGKQATKLAIINLQYTSKDKNAVLKINGKCDHVMRLVMQKLNLNVPDYDSTHDPLRDIATNFTWDEMVDLKRPLIFGPQSGVKPMKGEGPVSANSMKRSATEPSTSPSLFVSELTDEPDKKRLRIRIRAVNPQSEEISSPQADSPSPEHAAQVNHQHEKEPDATHAEVAERVSSLSNANTYTLPGWLGKSLGSNSRPSYYKRKRHGNKGRKHPSRQQKPIKHSDEATNESNADTSDQDGLNVVSLRKPLETSISNLISEEATNDPKIIDDGNQEIVKSSFDTISEGKNFWTSADAATAAVCSNSSGTDGPKLEPLESGQNHCAMQMSRNIIQSTISAEPIPAIKQLT